MSAREFVFKDVHLNFLTAGSIADIVFDPSKIKKPFIFLGSKQSYSAHYTDLFSELFEFRKAQRKGAAVKSLRLPFVRGVGSMIPLAGNETSNSPPYAGWGASMLGLARLGILPYKIYPNWKIGLDTDISRKFKLSYFRCQPLLKLYPFGVMAYQIRIRLKSSKGIDLGTFISFMKTIDRTNVLVAKKEKYSVRGLVLAFHKMIRMDVLGEERDVQDEMSARKFEFHRIITLNEMDPKLDPATNQKELAGIIAIEPNWNSPGKSLLKDQAKEVESRFENQFILFHPMCTLIYPARIKDQPGYLAFRTCLRNNLTSVLEFAKIENALTSDLSSKLEEMPAASDCSFDQIQERIELIARLKDRLKHYASGLQGYWGNHLQGIHRELFSTASSLQSWKPSTEKLFKELDSYHHDTMSLTLQETKLVQEIVKNAQDIAVTLDQLQVSAVPFGIDSAAMGMLAATARRIANNLTLSADALGEIAARAGTIDEDSADAHNTIIYRRSIMTELANFQKFLAGYEDVVVPLVKGTSGGQPSPQPVGGPGNETPSPAPSPKPAPTPTPTTTPTPTPTPTTTPTKPPSTPPVNGDALDKANQAINDALTAKDKLQAAYSSVVTFGNDVRPYAKYLLTGAKWFLRAIGVAVAIL